MLPLLLVAAISASKPGPLPLRAVRDVPLPGGATRFDYQWVDAAARRLYIAHLGDGSVLVFDLDTEKVLAEVKGMASVHGVVSAPDGKRLFATATGEKALAIIDLEAT